MSSASDHQIPSNLGDPTWEVAKLFPQQGRWRESDYFAIHTNRMVELVDGNLEILPMPTWLHQLMVVYLFDRLRDYLAAKQIGGVALVAPLPVRLFSGTIREPDVLYCSPKNVPTDPRSYPTKVDLVMEIVSEGDAARKRDYEDKRVDYAKAGIAEYWIIDAEMNSISVLALVDGVYHESLFKPSQLAPSRLLPEFMIDVNAIFAIANETRQP